MKRYISAILVPCLLLQLCGCYSYKLMTKEELRNYDGQNDIKIRTNQKEILINRQSNENGSMNWDSNDSSIIVEINKSIFLEDYNKLSSQEIEQLNNQTIEIKYNEIGGIEIEELNIVTTSLLAAGIGVIFMLALAAVSNIRYDL